MARRVAFVLLVICLGASALFAEARTHENFAATTYYESNKTVTTIVPKDVKGSNMTTDPLDRYPNGYPGSKHVWNKVTEKYESVSDTVPNPQNRYPNGYPGSKHVWDPAADKYEEKNVTTTNSTERYVHGYHGEANFDYKEGDTLTVVKSNGTVDQGVNKTDTDPLNRYPTGYPNSAHRYNAVTGKYETPGVKTVETNATNRYEHGYFGKAKYDYKEGDTLTVVKSNGTYTETSKETNVTGTQNRYPFGYYNENKPGANVTQLDATETSKESNVKGTQNRYPFGYYNENKPGSRVTQLDAAPYDPLNRYPNGYYGKSAKSTTQELKPVSYSSYSGNFDTLPYPSSGVPFVPSGGGCRTAYWAEHINAWPLFLKATTTVGDAFGETATGVYGQMTLLQALFKFGDPYSDLVRSAVTALLNAYTRGEFPLSYLKVVEQFIAALVSKEAAAAQALAFEKDNVASISAGNACT